MENVVLPKPLALGPGIVAESLLDLVHAVLDATEQQASKARLRDEEDRYDFFMSCDALNLWRMVLRLHEESLQADQDEHARLLSKLICEVRGYDPDEFESAKFATKERVRSPFGIDPLSLAFQRAQKSPIRLLHPDLSKSSIAAAIAAIAKELQLLVGKERVIFLPVEQIRELLERRKTVVSGTILRLLDAGVLELVNGSYHTKRAREFRFAGLLGKDFEEVASERLK